MSWSIWKQSTPGRTETLKLYQSSSTTLSLFIRRPSKVPQHHKKCGTDCNRNMQTWQLPTPHNFSENFGSRSFSYCPYQQIETNEGTEKCKLSCTWTFLVMRILQTPPSFTYFQTCNWGDETENPQQRSDESSRCSSFRHTPIKSQWTATQGERPRCQKRLSSGRKSWRDDNYKLRHDSSYHRSRSSYNRGNHHGSRSGHSNRGGRSRRDECYYCGRQGHKEYSCPDKKDVRRRESRNDITARIGTPIKDKTTHLPVCHLYVSSPEKQLTGMLNLVQHTIWQINVFSSIHLKM